MMGLLKKLLFFVGLPTGATAVYGVIAAFVVSTSLGGFLLHKSWVKTAKESAYISGGNACRAKVNEANRKASNLSRQLAAQAKLAAEKRAADRRAFDAELAERNEQIGAQNEKNADEFTPRWDGSRYVCGGVQ